MLLSTYCDPPLSWTSQWQQLQELYSTTCAALHLKPNSQVRSYLLKLSKEFQNACEIKSLDFSRFFLGRRGVIPVLAVLRQCDSLAELNLSSSGIDDFACNILCAGLAEHKSLYKIDLRENAFTGESVPSLHKLANCWKSRMKAKTSEGVSILVSEGVGITHATCTELSDWSQTTELASWAHSIVCRPKVSLLDKRRNLRSAKHTEDFSTDLRKMRQRLLIDEHMSSRVPSGTLQFTSDRWLVISVFISCSYNEFHDEGDLIHRIIFPRANWKLRSHRIHLVPVMLHSTLNEYYQPAATVEADGKEPLDYTRLPAFRKGSRGFAEDRAGRRHGVLFNEEGCHSSEVRSLLINDCDAFVGLYSDMFDASIHQNDFLCAKQMRIPVMAFKRKASGVPVEFAHLHDYRRHLELSYSAQNANLNGRSFGARNPKSIEADIDSDLKVFKTFEKTVKQFCDKSYSEYEAPYSRVYRGGERRFDIDEIFVETFITNLISLGHMYLKRREGGSCPNAGVFDATEEHSRTARKLPEIICRNWGRQPAALTFTKSLVDAIVAPYKTEEEILRIKHGVKAKENVAPLVEDTKSLNTEAQSPNGEAGIIETPFCAITGEAGSGKTTQLRAVAASIVQDRLAAIAKHSVIHGKPTLLYTMVALLQQFYRRYSEAGGSVFNNFVGPEVSESDLVQAFCTALREAPMINEYSNRICFFIDDDDLLDVSFAQLFLNNPQYYDMLQKATPSEECKVQIFFTTSSSLAVYETNPLLTIHAVPLFTEVQAADLFCHYAIGNGEVHPRILEKAKEAAKRIAFTKRHGTRPLYIYLAAREVAYYLESTPITAIVEVLPETVEEIAGTAMKVALPPDLECFFEAISSAPEPFSGAMLRFGLSNYRQYPYFTEKTSERYRWCTPRTWGRITEPLPASAGIIGVCNANFCHLFDHCLRQEGSGFLTHRWSQTRYNVWRNPWRFSHRTVLQAAQKIFNPTSKATLPHETTTFKQIWDRALRRLSYLREGPFASRALSNIVDPSYVLESPHRMFALMNAKAYDELLLLFTSLRKVIPPDTKGERLLMEYASYFHKHWPILKRHRAFLYSCPWEAPADIKSLLSDAQKRNPCAHLENASTISVSSSSADAHCITVLKSSQLKSVCVAYRTLTNVKPHEVTASMVARGADDGFGKVFVFLSSAKPVIYAPHQTAICTVEMFEDASLVVRIATAAYFETKIQLAVVTADGASVVGALTLDFLPRAPLRVAVSPWNSTLLQRSASLADFPMVAFGDKTVLVVAERHGEKSKKPKLHRFEGHDTFIVCCGFSPAGCKVFSVDTNGHCMLWGAPEGPFSGNILAVTKLPSIPKEARMIDHNTLLYSTNDGVFTWNAETSHVNNIAPFIKKNEVGNRYAIVYDKDSKWPQSVACVDLSTKLVQWFSSSDKELSFENCDFLRIQDHASTTDAIGNVEVESWSWRFGTRFAVGYDVRERMLKLFHRAARRQVPMFFALPDSHYIPPSKFDVVELSEGRDQKVVPVFREIVDFATLGLDDQFIISCDDEGNVNVLEYHDGPLLYPSDPYALE